MTLETRCSSSIRTRHISALLWRCPLLPGGEVMSQGWSNINQSRTPDNSLRVRIQSSSASQLLTCLSKADRQRFLRRRPRLVTDASPSEAGLETNPCERKSAMQSRKRSTAAAGIGATGCFAVNAATYALELGTRFFSSTAMPWSRTRRMTECAEWCRRCSGCIPISECSHWEDRLSAGWSKASVLLRRWSWQPLSARWHR